jgi:chitodextrinase
MQTRINQSLLLCLIGSVLAACGGSTTSEGNAPAQEIKAAAAACNAAWVSTTAYNGGALVSYGGVNYKANWWTQGNNPLTNSGAAGSGQPWTSTGVCGSTTPTPVPTPTPAPASGIVSGAVYTLVNPNSGKALDVKSAGTADGTAVDIYTVNGTAAQNWQINSNGDGTWSLVNPNSGRDLDVVAAGTANGTAVDIYTANGTVAQKWQINANSDGSVTLVNPNSGKALDVAAAGTADGTAVDIYTPNGTAAQKWTLTQVATTSTMSMLHASGRNIVNANGSAVKLRGFNLGGWFIMEKWMSPLDSSGLVDTYSVMQTLDNRFGVATEQSLIKTYQQSWITTGDLDNIKNAGFNLVRVPVWWGQFYALNNVSNSGWRSDAFSMLDWLVSNAAARGLYVVIDMHGVVGGQSVSDDTGQANQNAYWANGSDQGNTAWMWWQIASHYKGNPTVAGYDLINEPVGAPNMAAVWSAYNSLYGSVRSADPDHMIFLEGAFGNWNWDMLPPPSQYGWTNVVYEMHEYQYNKTAAQVQAGSTNQVNDFNNHASWNVPGYIGELLRLWRLDLAILDQCLRQRRLVLELMVVQGDRRPVA